MTLQPKNFDFLEETLNPLAEAFRYSPDDLQRNRNRRLSPRQKRRLWLRFISTALGGVLLMLAPVLVTWGLVLWSTDLSMNAVLSEQRAFVGYAFGLILGGFYGLSNIKSLMLSLDLLQGRVRTIKGPAHLWGSYLLLGKYRFVVDNQAAMMVQAGVSYRAYLLPASSTLLSIEFAD